jgi:hypothetical protein
MLKLPPPVWALIYVLAAAAVSWVLSWPTLPGLFAPLGVALVAVACIPSVSAMVLFHRAKTDISPTGNQSSAHHERPLPIQPKPDVPRSRYSHHRDRDLDWGLADARRAHCHLRYG